MMINVSHRINSGKAGPDLRFLFLSPAARHALLGMRALALLSGTRFELVGGLAKRTKLPAGSLAKVFQRLARCGLLISQRGPGGGYSLARPAAQIDLAEILRAVQDIIPGGHHCLLGNHLCGEGGDFCPIHRIIIKADQLVIEGFKGLSLQDLARSDGWT